MLNVNRLQINCPSGLNKLVLEMEVKSDFFIPVSFKRDFFYCQLTLNPTRRQSFLSFPFLSPNKVTVRMQTECLCGIASLNKGDFQSIISFITAGWCIDI